MLERNPVAQLILANLKSYLREPEAIFWTYGFPLLMIVGLGLAFNRQGPQKVVFDVVEGPAASRVGRALEGNERFTVVVNDREQALLRLKRNRTPLVVSIDEAGGYRYHFDPTNAEGAAARAAVDDALQRAAGRKDAVEAQDARVTAPGARYVDWLVPGLIGMNLMGGGLWGVGFVLVDMRVKNLLKRLLGTPMRRSHFLLAIVGGRVVFFIPEAFFLLLSAWLIFKIPIAGHPLTVLIVAFAGAVSFAGLGLLVSSRARRIETVSGLMNFVMMPMWLCSGIFFSSDRFPAFMQPFIRALPLTQLIDSLRAVILEGQSLTAQAVPLTILGAWAAVSYGLALRWFRWT